MLDRAHSSTRLALACLILAVIGCADVLGPEHEELAEARNRWAEARVDSYQFKFQRICFCAPDFVRSVRIEVLAGTVTSAVYVDTGEPISGPLSSVPMIEDLFDEIQDAMDHDAFSLMADYDADIGYPTSVSIDFNEQTIDEEMAFSVSSFQLLDP